MCTVGQDEIVIVLECLPDEKTVPRDIFSHLNTVYEEAGKGELVVWCIGRMEIPSGAHLCQENTAVLKTLKFSPKLAR
jgi:vacuolar-type H+-ATPase subunit B/Vma2